MRAGRWLADHVVMMVAMLVLLYMFLPIFFVVLMSFNDPASRLSYEFDGFTLNNWLDPCGPSGMCASVVKSLQIGFLATLGATVLGASLARGAWQPRPTAYLLAVSFPFWFVVSGVLGHNGLGLLPTFLAWAVYGRSLLTPEQTASR